MKYNIIIEKPAEKFIMKLSRPEKEREARAIIVCALVIIELYILLIMVNY